MLWCDVSQHVSTIILDPPKKPSILPSFVRSIFRGWRLACIHIPPTSRWSTLIISEAPLDLWVLASWSCQPGVSQFWMCQHTWPVGCDTLRPCLSEIKISKGPWMIPHFLFRLTLRPSLRPCGLGETSTSQWSWLSFVGFLGFNRNPNRHGKWHV